MTIDELMAKVRAELPGGWRVHVQVEGGVVTVLLEDPEGDDCELVGRHKEDAIGVEAAVLAALAQSKEWGPIYEDCEEDDDE